MDIDKLVAGLKDVPPKVFANDRGRTLGASEASVCIRKLGHQKQGGGTLSFSSGFALRGDIMEDWLTQRLTALGYAFEKQVFLQADDAPLSATLDCVLSDPVGIIECKTFDPRITELPKPRHLYQFNIQRGLLGIQHPEVKESGRAILLYINASDMFDIRVFSPPFSETQFWEAKERARRVFSTKDLPPEGLFDGEDCADCPLWERCKGEKKSEIKPSKQKPVDPAAESLLQEVMRGQQAEEELKAHLNDHHSGSYNGLQLGVTKNGFSLRIRR